MKVVTVTGPSGSGKDSIVDALLYVLKEKPFEELTPFVQENIAGLNEILVPSNIDKPLFMRELISHTTRGVRVGEVHGKDYYFITKEEFDVLPKVEETCYAGNYYCLSQMSIDSNPADVGIVIVDIEGKEAVKEFVEANNGIAISIFLEVDKNVIEGRMRKRGDTEENIKTRLEKAEKDNEFLNGPKCDYIVKNDDFVVAVKDALAIIASI